MQLFFRQMGETGSHVVMLHGLFGSSDNWLTMGKQLAEQGFRVWILDQRNHGQSPHTDSHTYDDMAEDLHQFLQDHQVENPMLMGHSMGGKTVMQYTMTYSDAVAKLVVVDMAPKPYPVHHAELIEAMRALPIDQLSTRAEADQWLQSREPSLMVRQFLLKNLYRTEQGTFGWRLNLPLLEQELDTVSLPLSNTHAVQTPTLFIRGSRSHYILDDDWPDILKLFPNAALETIEGAGHWVHAEKPAEFFTALLSFLR